jgi:hypothetical protein
VADVQMSDPLALATYDAICGQIAACATVADAQAIEEKAATLRDLCKRAGHKDKEAELRWRTVSLLAGQRIGEITRTLRRTTPSEAGVAGGHAKAGTSDARTRQEASEFAQALADSNLTKQRASIYERLAAIPKETVEVLAKETGSAEKLVERHAAAQRRASTVCVAAAAPRPVVVEQVAPAEARSEPIGLDKLDAEALRAEVARLTAENERLRSQPAKSPDGRYGDLMERLRLSVAENRRLERVLRNERETRGLDPDTEKRLQQQAGKIVSLERALAETKARLAAVPPDLARAAKQIKAAQTRAGEHGAVITRRDLNLLRKALHPDGHDDVSRVAQMTEAMQVLNALNLIVSGPAEDAEPPRPEG